MTLSPPRAAPARTHSPDHSLDETIADGVERIFRLLTASGEINWASGITEDAPDGPQRIREVARLAVSLAALPEAEGDEWLAWAGPPSAPAVKTTSRRKRAIYFRRRAPRAVAAPPPPGAGVWLSRWALAAIVLAALALPVVAWLAARVC
ncbi:MAG: hypothetical protein U0556_15825 [Dehalococcoidia bacterium]